ncbi:MAG: DUF1838 family protein [Woeseiaceae bacterium]
MPKRPDHESNRRDFLTKAGKTIIGAGIAGAGVSRAHAMTSSKAAADSAPADYSTLKYGSNLWNRDAYSRLVGDLDFGKEKFGWYRGKVMGVKAGEPVRDLFGFEGFSMARLLDDGNGVYKKLLREVGFYTDLKTGEVLEEYENPYTGETVNVVPVANDPFNVRLGPFFPRPPSYGGLNDEKAAAVPDIPFMLPWREVGSSSVLMTIGINLFYPSALQPDKWPRESSGPMNRVTEIFNHVIDKDLLANPENTTVEFAGTWTRVTPWLPWMLMGQSEGHCLYNCEMGGGDGTRNAISQKVFDYAEKHYPLYFSAPDKWEDPSLSSLERYALEQKPAPVK